jgi:hypothetical protein
VCFPCGETLLRARHKKPINYSGEGRGANGEGRRDAPVGLFLFVFLTAENTEVAENFDLGNMFTKKRKIVAKSWQQIPGKSENVANRIFHNWATLLLTMRHALSVLRNL